MQMANKNSRPVKKINMDATTIDAIFKLKMNRLVITAVIKNPRRAAKIFGALSISLTGKLSELLKEWLVKLIGLNFISVKALMKKSVIRKMNRNTEFKIKAKTIIPIANIAFRRVTCSFTR